MCNVVNVSDTKRADFSNFWHMHCLEAVFIFKSCNYKGNHFEQDADRGFYSRSSMFLNIINKNFTDKSTFHISDRAPALFDSKHKRLNRTHSKREDDLMDSRKDRTHLSTRASLACSVWFHWCCGEPWKTHLTSYCCPSLIRPRLNRTHETMQTRTEEVEVWITERMDFCSIACPS